MLLNDITPSVASGYWDWRIGFWDSAEGKALQKHNPKRRGAKTRGTNNARKTPATKTLLMEQSALNQIFYDAFERGLLQAFADVAANENVSNHTVKTAWYKHRSYYKKFMREMQLPPKQIG